MKRPQGVVRDRAGKVHRVTCLHSHSHGADPSMVECSVWEIKTGTEAMFDIQILLDGEARRAWGHRNPNMPFCPGVELPEPIGDRRFGGALGVVEAVLHSTDLQRNSRVLVDSEGRLSLVDKATSVRLRNADGTPVSIELSLPEGSHSI